MYSAISENSRRIARNTLLLYFRMLLMMVIGLYTSRVVLDALGETDYGVHNAVGSMVMVFTFITTSVSSAISRFLAVELGRGDGSKLRKVFSAGLAVQLIFAAALVILAETLGLWFLNERMNIPLERMHAARVVFHCSLGVLVVNLLSVPFNATIIAHEKMSAFAFISILEAVLKLSVALLLYFTISNYVNPIYKIADGLNTYRSSGKRYAYILDGEDHLSDINAGVTELVEENMELKRRVKNLKEEK